VSWLKLKAIGLVLFRAALARQRQPSPTAVIEMGWWAIITDHPLASTDSSIARSHTPTETQSAEDSVMKARLPETVHRVDEGSVVKEILND